MRLPSRSTLACDQWAPQAVGVDQDRPRGLSSVVRFRPRTSDSGAYNMARVSAFSRGYKTIGHDRPDDCGPCQIKYGGFFIHSAALG